MKIFFLTSIMTGIFYFGFLVPETWAKDSPKEGLNSTPEVQGKEGAGSVTKRAMGFLKSMDSKYIKQRGIQAQLKKETFSSFLNRPTLSQGQIWLDKSKMKIEIRKPEVSQIIVDGSRLWIIPPVPQTEIKPPPQVLHCGLRSQRARSQPLVQWLTGGGILKHFKVSSFEFKGEKAVYFLKPNQGFESLKRSKIVISKTDQVILQISYWDLLDNETRYTLSHTKFNQKIPGKLFKYRPPKQAQVLSCAGG